MYTGVQVCPHSHTCQIHIIVITHTRKQALFSLRMLLTLCEFLSLLYICIFGCLEQSYVHRKWSGERSAFAHSPLCTQAQLPSHHHSVRDVYLHQSVNRQSPCFTSSFALGLYSTGFGKSIMACNYSYDISQNTCPTPNQILL